MRMTKILRITVTGKKKECKEVFDLLKATCDVEVEELYLHGVGMDITHKGQPISYYLTDNPKYGV